MSTQIRLARVVAGDKNSSPTGRKNDKHSTGPYENKVTQLGAVLESKSWFLLAPEAGPFCREGGAKTTGSIGPSVKHWQMVSFLPASQSSWPPMEAAALVPSVEHVQGCRAL
ncbi:hypothetical protein CFAM422_002977 [Trichoderma lentiforme]|uniref:Uncharacterized protein n=1 Tax=Trichoderma lentiforme TaxID=1567552 RepID=A0A9P5CHK5_9HYPO|nr:hypothetical protein CFAM422_002977 [Trichoderma lentiforme]